MLNPDHNLFSVAPVGSIVVIGRQMTLRGGLTRERAINLITWLSIATNATREEIAAEMKLAGAGGGTISFIVAPTAPAPTVQRVAEFVGTVDAEEATAIADGVKRAGEMLENGAGKI